MADQDVDSDKVVIATKPEETPDITPEEETEAPPQKEDSPKSESLKDESPAQDESLEQTEPEQLKQETGESPETEQPQEEDLPAEEQGEEQAPPQMSKRKAERLAKLENLVSKLKGDEAPVAAPEQKGMDYRQVLDTDDDAVISQFEEDRKSVAQSSYNEGLEKAKSIQFHTRLEIDAPKVESKYSVLDKDSPDFRPETADAINRWYLTSVGYNPQTDTVTNPGVRYSDFVEGIMELSDSMAGEKVESSKKNIAAQAANTGLRPDGSTTKLNLNKNPQDMTNEELSTVIKRAARNLAK